MRNPKKQRRALVRGKRAPRGRGAISTETHEAISRGSRGVDQRKKKKEGKEKREIHLRQELWV